MELVHGGDAAAFDDRIQRHWQRLVKYAALQEQEQRRVRRRWFDRQRTSQRQSPSPATELDANELRIVGVSAQTVAKVSAALAQLRETLAQFDDR